MTSRVAVVTNASYTRGGVELADRIGVLLLSAREIGVVDKGYPELN